jgi:hypothetical protein
MQHNTILAIDPGTVQSAFVLWDSLQKSILEKGIVQNEAMLHRVMQKDYDIMACEMIASYGMPVGREVFETVLWIGRFVQATHDKHSLIYRKDVKMHLCNSTRAKDGNIRQALLDLLGKEATKGVHKDIWAALGVAVTFSSRDA